MYVIMCTIELIINNVILCDIVIIVRCWDDGRTEENEIIWIIRTHHLPRRRCRRRRCPHRGG